MTSWQSLLACSQADVTFERIADIATATGTETLTVEFKEQHTPRIADCVAAMANLYGGLIFVGVTDSDHKIVGVKHETMTHIADMLTQRLDPAGYLPEMFEVDIPTKPGYCILVIRVQAELAPRPVLVQRTVGSGNDKTNVFWLPIRTPGGTRPASRAEMAALFSEQQNAAPQQLGWDINAPSFPTGQDGAPDRAIDLMIRTGLFIPPGPSAGGRPLSDRVIASLCAALNKSPMARFLSGLTGLMSVNLYDFDRRGPLNTSSNATLTWQVIGDKLDDPAPVGVAVQIKAPNQYGFSHIQTLEVTIDITIRMSAWMNANRAPAPPPPAGRYRMEVMQWFLLLDSLIATMTDSQVVAALADMAAIDPIIVPAPRTVHLVSGEPIAGLLPPLPPIPGGRSGHGAYLRANPTLDLADSADRQQQVIQWLIQIAGDASLRGMEQLVATMPGTATS